MAHAFLAALLSGMMISHPAAADIIKLRDGLEHRGDIANREQVRVAPRAFAVVSILVDSADRGNAKLIRIARADIDYLVFEDADGQQVIDLEALHGLLGSAESADTGSTGREKPKVKAAGPVLMITGCAIGIFGAMTKLGGEELRISGDSAEWEKTYNDLNYFLMVTGGLMFAFGLGLVARGSPPTSGFSGAIPDGVAHLAYTGTF